MVINDNRLIVNILILIINIKRNTFINRLSYYVDMIESTEIYGNFNNYLLNLVEPIYLDIKWEDDKSDSWLKRYIHIHL